MLLLQLLLMLLLMLLLLLLLLLLFRMSMDTALRPFWRTSLRS
jgi:hypothetical protein